MDKKESSLSISSFENLIESKLHDMSAESLQDVLHETTAEVLGVLPGLLTSNDVR